jgi:hypothetical protein
MAGKLQRKLALKWTLEDYIQGMIEKGKSIYWSTLTFSEDVTELYAKKVLHRILSLARYYKISGIWVREYQTSGRIHYHIISDGVIRWHYGFCLTKKITFFENDLSRIIEYCNKEFNKEKQRENCVKYSKSWGKFGYVQRTTVREIEIEYKEGNFF